MCLVRVPRGCLRQPGAAARVGRDGAHRRPRPVEELILEPERPPRDGLAILLGQIRPRCEEGIELTPAGRVDLAVELPEDRADILLLSLIHI